MNIKYKYIKKEKQPSLYYKLSVHNCKNKYFINVFNVFTYLKDIILTHIYMYSYLYAIKYLFKITENMLNFLTFNITIVC